MQTNKSLILLTNNYPANYGDTSFINSEADALSKLYDSVYIIRFANNHNYIDVKMPENFHLLELGLSGKSDILIKGIFNPTSLIRTIKLFSQELKYLSKLTHLKNLIFATLCGRYFSSKINKLTKNIQHYDIYSFWGIGSGYSLPWLISKNFRKIWVRLHGGDLYLERQHGYIPYRKALFSVSDAIIPISQQGERYLKNTYPLENIQSKLFTNYLGSIDYGPPPSFDSRPTAYVIISCSSIIPLKRVELIFQSINLASQSQQIIWHHFGDGCNMPKLKSLIQYTKSESKLKIMLHGQVSHEKIIEFYQKNHVDLFINLSETEGIPVSIMEAISFNIPVIATNVGGVSEIVNQQFGTGLLVDADSSAITVCEKILELQKLTNLHPRYYWLKHLNKISNLDKLFKHLATPPKTSTEILATTHK